MLDNELGQFPKEAIRHEFPTLFFKALKQYQIFSSYTETNWFQLFLKKVYFCIAVFAFVAWTSSIMNPIVLAENDPPIQEKAVSVDIEILGWIFTPVIQNGVILGFVAQATKEITVIGNLEILWFEHVANGGWQEWSWAGSNTAANALGWIRDYIHDEAAFDANPNLLYQILLNPIQSEDTDWNAPTSFDRGLLENDPLQLLLSDNERTPELFENLSRNGWEVAPELSQLSAARFSDNAGVDLQQFLNALVERTHAYMQGTPFIESEAVSSESEIMALWCICHTSYSAKSCSAWQKTGSTTGNIGGGSFKVEWRRSCKTRWRKLGDYSLSCFDCTGDGEMIIHEYIWTTQYQFQPVIVPTP